MERTFHVDDSAHHPLGDHSRNGLNGPHEQGISLHASDGGFHLASVAEKKRIWWRNAIINTLFIASW